MTLQEYVSEQFVGKNKDLNLIQRDIYKTLKEGWKEKLGYLPLRPMALITIHNPESQIIESIGFSDPDDLILDNFGLLLAANFTNATASTATLTDTAGNPILIAANNDFSQFYYNRTTIGAMGAKMRIGQGTPLNIQRTDFQLDTPFVALPEFNFITITPGGWITANQQVVVNGLIAGAGAGGNITECGMFGQWRGAPNDFMLSHDAVGGTFFIGQNINVTYTWSIT